ncbi:hypothetical protein [Streptomyces sp.]|uniref:hypothetical protein n=1 Tax=Streptomyces sp. TaxID=1931 RepID=UPI002F95F879
MAETTTNRGKYEMVSKWLAAADLRCCYFTGTQTGTADPDLDTVADLEAVTSVAVAAERIALANETATQDDTNNRVNIDCDTIAFSAAPGVTAQGVAIYQEGASDAARNLIGIYTTGFPQPVDGGLNVNVSDFFRQG